MLGQILSFIIAGVFLAGAFYFITRKQHHWTGAHHWSGALFFFTFVTFLVGELSGSKNPVVQNGFTAEQWLCWIFGLLFFIFAGFLVRSKELAYGFVAFLIAAFTCFCGLSGVQSFLKTQMLWMVTDTLKSYGDKIDRYQDTVIAIQNRLSAKQDELESNQTILIAKMNAQKGELESIQAKIRETQTNILCQESNLALAQTNLDAQQQKLSDVETLVSTLFTNTEYEHLGAWETNNVAVLNRGYELVVCRLKKAPVPNTIQGIASGGGLQFQVPLLPDMAQFGNIICIKIGQGADLTGVTFDFRYIADNRRTNLVQNMTVTGTNSISFDGQPAQINL